jgi:hypothetical protein
MVPDGVPVAKMIDGSAWRLPLAPLSATSLPEPYSPGALLPGWAYSTLPKWCIRKLWHGCWLKELAVLPRSSWWHAASHITC